MILAEWIRELRELERAAAAQPGYESDHDHVPSPPYNEYQACLERLPTLLNTAPLPQAWLELEDWCAGNSFWFGDVSSPGVHQAAMQWEEQARSLRHLLLLCILWRAQERLTRPEDDRMWSLPETAALLARGATWPERERLWSGQPSFGLFLYPDPITNVLALLGARGVEILKAITSPLSRQRYAVLAAKHARFQLGDMAFSKTGQQCCLVAQFAQTLLEEDIVYLALADRETHQPHPLLEIPMRVDNGGLHDIHQRSRGADPSWTEVQVHPDRATARITDRDLHRPAWPAPWDKPESRRTLCVQVRGLGPWYFAPVRS